MSKTSKTEEKILAAVKRANDLNGLAWLGTDPSEPNYNSSEFRFVKRLADKGAIVFLPWTPKFGIGWALSENVRFRP